MHRVAHVLWQRMRRFKRGIVGIEELLEDATGHD
jgi:hypothetical protein